MKRVVMGIVETPMLADVTTRRLVGAGFSPGDIVVLYPDRHGDRDLGFEARTRAPEGALLGIGFGAILGAMLGLAGALAGAVPELAPLGRLGPLLLALGAAAAGALVFGIGGAVAGAAARAIEAKVYDGKTRFGSILVAVHAERRADVRRARRVLRSVVASDVATMGEAALPLSSRA